jgi:DNA replication and repair protein RecF
MFISNLYIRNFRNIEKLELCFNKSANFLKGYNGAGKTNIIESIYCLSSIKSFRNAKDCDMVKKGDILYFIKCIVEDEKIYSYEIGFSLTDKKKKLKIDGNEISKSYDYYGKIPSVVFSPIDIELVNGTGDIFRKYIDGVICKYDRDYFINLQNYRKCIHSRNIILRKNSDNSKKTKELYVWNEMMANLIEQIMKTRKYFLNDYLIFFKKSYNEISGNDEDLDIKYYQSVKSENKESILDEINKSLNKDVSLGYTCLGPHRDRYIFINEKGFDFTKVSSQGQKRTASISFKIAESGILQKSISKKSIFLVDDIFSELDIKRQKNLLRFLNGGNQIFFTMTDISKELLSTFESCNVYNIDKGSAFLQP